MKRRFIGALILCLAAILLALIVIQLALGQTYIFSRNRLQLVTTLTFATAGNCKLAYNAGGAMVFDAAGVVDLSPYAGVEGSSTGFFLQFMDGNTPVASAFGGAAGGGEALGAELNTDVGFANAGSWSVTASAWAILGGKAVATAAGNNAVLYLTAYPAITEGKIYKTTIDVDAISGKIAVGGFGTYELAPFQFATTGTKTIYHTKTAVPNMYFGLVSKQAGTNATLDNLSAKALTDVSAQGIHLISVRNGDVHSLTSTGAGDVNAITKVLIYRAF